ncbi:hypothetical protein NP233_g7966 [Leucocoprinus birnbaumii]|uniref:Integrase catalytic domain-containing protein n=1 Tax=Leucocoprinus birnbaumii TaxID=56174 RepID=A0AAD5VTP7_9AGAR|nr:hypothetical protein NP233_g7966 [Leucocoprinus birnbaumii]
MNVPTWDGYTYALVMVEVSCCYPTACLLRSKEDIDPAVYNIIALLKRQLHVKAYHIRSNNGTEFVNSVMDNFCKTNGIIHETSNPYHPEQNRIAEYAIAIFLEMMRCILHAAEIDLRYWGEAFILASIDLPRVTTEEIDEFINDAIDDKTPSESKSGQATGTTEQTLSTPPTIVSPLLHLPPAPKKTAKWSNLPKCKLSSCTQKPVQHYGQHETTYIAFLTIGGEPENYWEMMDSSSRDGWQTAIDAEYCQLKERGVFEWVENLPGGKKVVGGHIVYYDKLNGHGNHIKYKAHIVAQESVKIPGKDFTGTFSSVAKFTTLCAFLSLAAFLDFDIHQINIVGAYLQGDLNEEIYMEIPEGINDLDAKGGYWHLQKPLYGLKQVGRQWKKHLHEVLMELGFV